ncbi:MAG: hypothetical protein ABSD39_22105 [Terriglobales bacterium]|jgi:hypothetical protein
MKNNLMVLGLALCILPMSLAAETGQDVKRDYLQEQNARSTERIPAGTIIPVKLNSTLRSDKSGSGDAITATVMQDVPLGGGEMLRKGTKVTGHVVQAITMGKKSEESKISFQFDQVRLGNQTIPVTTNLCAVASGKEVFAATPQQTTEGPDSQVEIGGDQISYGDGRPVMVGSQVVGKYTSQGVLAYAGQDVGTPCRGTTDDSDHPQAFWLFSVNACGPYGFEGLTVFHSGRTEPLGEVTLTSNGKAVNVGKGSAMLLRVEGSSTQEAQARTTPSRGTGQ